MSPLDAHKLVVKFFAQEPVALDKEQLVPIFHSWIQSHAIPDHLLIDVADYDHVVGGPGIVLVAHEANFSTDREGGRLGLMYNRKTPLAGDFRQRVASAFLATLAACGKLQSDPRLGGKLRFGTGEVLFKINDRLAAPNTPETFAAVEPELRTFLTDLYAGAELKLEGIGSGQDLFQARASASKAPSIADLLSRLAPMAAAR